MGGTRSSSIINNTNGHRYRGAGTVLHPRCIVTAALDTAVLEEAVAVDHLFEVGTSVDRTWEVLGEVVLAHTLGGIPI